MQNKPTLGPIVIGVKNIEKALPFYVAVLEIEVEKQSPHYLLAHLNGAPIELEEYSENRFPNWEAHNVGTFKCVEIAVSDMDAFLEKVVEHGGTVITPSTPRPWGGFGAEISDPDGNIFPISQK